MTIRACVFDAYGTLFDVSAAARQASGEPGNEKLADIWPSLAANWRAKQLQYSWLRAITGEHADFWTVTKAGLDWALDAAGLSEERALRERLLALYWELSAYPEVPVMLEELRSAGFLTAILSNGSPEMLGGAIRSAGLDGVLDAALSVEEVGIFKPDRRVYELVERHFGIPPGQVLFVSSNGWDVSAAAGFGFRTLWVNRAGEPMDRLPHDPEHQAHDLAGVAKLAKGL